MADVFDELEEEDVWAVMRDRKEGSPRARTGARGDPTSPAFPCRRLPTAARATRTSSSPHAGSGGGGGGDGRGKAFREASAPVNIPDWSKIYGKKASSGGRSCGGATAAGLGDGHSDDREAGCGLDVGDDEDDGDGMLPPHEWIARKLARSQISSFSVCEGAGRTLKGRDLSRVRNAVLSRTGFLE